MTVDSANPNNLGETLTEVFAIERRRNTMGQERKLYPSFRNPLCLKPERSLTEEIAVIGEGTSGTDIGYCLKSREEKAGV